MQAERNVWPATKAIVDAGYRTGLRGRVTLDWSTFLVLSPGQGICCDNSAEDLPAAARLLVACCLLLVALVAPGARLDRWAWNVFLLQPNSMG